MKALSKLLLPILTIGTILFSCSVETPSSSSSASKLITDQFARIAIPIDPLSLDPRLTRELTSINVMHAVFEGLMRRGADNQLEHGVAKNVEISPDHLTYTFSLRESTWSDGSPVTATDFVETWKSLFHPTLPSSNAYLLYAIKGAKKAKEGNASIEEIGVHATSPTTLIVELEQPTPYFLELLTSCCSFPVHAKMRNQEPNSFSSKPSEVIGNGPFKIIEWKHRNEMILAKNSNYWNDKAVELKGIVFQVLEDNAALQLFKAGELDWAGSPISTLPQDAILPLKQAKDLNIASAAGTHFFRFNTQKPPFDNINMRQAFNLALNRLAIVEHVTQGNQLPAMSIVPPSWGIFKYPFFKDNDSIGAKKHYMAALIDLKNSGKKLPEISLCYISNERHNKVAQAVQQQWNKAFGICVKLESYDSQILFQKLRSGDYQINLGSWYADILDPINFLEIFKTKDTPTNNTYWENPRYTQLLDESSTTISPEERNQILAEAETLLIEELPVAPLFHGSFNYLTSKRLKNVRLLESGVLDFSHALIED